ncbi:MAG TPA: hypothetical protein VEI03_07550 [Stellaceae bacterium]|nr:hypothetical protein [Stellaceae bacterium]
MSTIQEHELESEFEQELQETELEASEQEGVLGSIGNVLGGLLGEGESTGESEFELEGEGEFESEFEFETEMELEGAEHFSFGSIGNFLKKAAPILKQVARVAAPVVGTAIGGPFGGMLGGLAAKALSEQELEMELEGAGEMELETEFETEQESEQEVAQEIASHELPMHEALAEMMAEAATHEVHSGQAEAMAGAAVMTVLSPRDRRALRHLLPHLVCGAAVLTRILRRRRITRPAVRAVPTIMRRTVKSLKRQAAAGRPITRRAAARTAARQVRRVLSNPRAVGAAVVRNVRAGRAVKRRHSRYPAGRG